jgi:hypothetical protein
LLGEDADDDGMVSGGGRVMRGGSADGDELLLEEDPASHNSINTRDKGGGSGASALSATSPTPALEDSVGLSKTMRTVNMWLIMYGTGATVGSNAVIQFNIAQITESYGARFSIDIYTRGCHWFPHLLV